MARVGSVDTPWPWLSADEGEGQQIVNSLSVVELSFDGRASIPHNWDLSMCQINQPFKKVNIYAFLIGQKYNLCAKLSNEDIDCTLSRDASTTPPVTRDLGDSVYNAH